jgi:hypothetical protein
MMHGREKSDSVIVAVKSPNKTGEPRTWDGSAEPAPHGRNDDNQHRRDDEGANCERIHVAARTCL